MKVRSLVLALGLLLAASSARADVITLDQVVVPNGGGFGSGGLAQTFTVGLTGELVGVDVAAWSGDPLFRFYLFGTTAGVPDANQILATSLVSIPFETRVGGFQPTIFFSPISVSVGDVLAIVLISHITNGGGISDWKQTATPYEGGTVFNIGDGIANGFVDQGIDLGFRTYVNTDAASTTVPEPASLLLFGAGLIGIGGTKLRKRLKG